ncbi:MAG TPA: beta-galactosidase, partial [Chloroflexota bacterium]|nr:beta-galactosidase [Chloroflexota bacterium]
RQTPSSGRVGGPGIVQNGRAIYFSHPIFSQYHQNAPRWCKTLLLNALKLLLPEPLLRHSGPSTLFAALNEQAAEHRWILHALHCIPERRGLDFDVIEDVIPLHEVKFSIKTDRPVRSVVAVPQNQSLSFHLANGRVEFILPRLEGHQMVALSFGATD